MTWWIGSWEKPWKGFASTTPMFDPHEHMHPDVEDIDLVEIAEYIILNNPDAARAVVTAIRETFILLAAQPMVGTEFNPSVKSSGASACFQSQPIRTTSFTTARCQTT